MMHHISQRQKAIVMSAVMSAMFLVALDQTIIATALGKIVEEFQSFSSLTWVVTAYMLTTTVTVPIAGKMSDIFGRRKILLSGVVIFVLGSFLSGGALDINQLIFARAFQGIGGGIIMANAFTIAGDLFSPRERGKWQGLIGAVFGLSSVIGPLLGGFLTDPHTFLGLTTNWRWTFWINVPIGIVSFAIIAKYLPVIRHDHRPKIDYLGASFITVALASLILAVDNTDKVFASLIDDGISLTAIKSVLYSLTALATAGFIWAERRADEPIIPLRFFRNRNFSLFMLIALLFGAAFLGAILYLTQFNQQVFGANATESGLMLLPMVFGLATTATLTGRMISRTGSYKVFLLSGLFTLIGLLISDLLVYRSDPRIHSPSTSSTVS
jgi:EmrB/QacA subfamily drug resistance transporter